MPRAREFKPIKTSRHLRSLANEWLKMFGLTDWVVEVSFVRGDSAELNGDSGSIFTLPERKVAAVYICRPCDMDSGDEDIEQVLVHELLHLFFAALPARSAELQRLTESQAVDRLATVLVSLRR